LLRLPGVLDRFRDDFKQHSTQCTPPS
jgi:hypothetical protein